MSDPNAYILGTDKEELDRLELQHKVWSTETRAGWSNAEFHEGQTILDLGCGPGYCSIELADVVGPNGKVVALDRSKSFITHLDAHAKELNLPIETIHSDFSAMILEDECLDGVYSRWALAWVPNPKEIIAKVVKALKPGGRIVFHEYFDWSTHHVFPEAKNLTKGINSALKSFKESDSEIDVGAFIPEILDSCAVKIMNNRLMPKLASPNTKEWRWPTSFYKSYFPRLIEMGYLTPTEVEDAFSELEQIEKLHFARLACPLMIEIIAEKN